MNSEYFYYNGVYSSDYNIYLVNVDAGLKNDRFLAEKEIISETVAGSDIPYIYAYRKKPLILNLTLALIDDKWTYENRQKLARLLDINKFAKFYSADNPSKQYFLTYIGGIDLTHNMAEDGYITVTMQNLYPYALSPMYTETFINESGTNIFEFTSKGDDTVLPEMSIKKLGNGDLSIKNLSDGGKEFKFTDLADNEQIYVDNKNRHIETDIPLTYRHDNFNNNYLELPRGVNRIEVSGGCEITFRYQYAIKG